MLRGGAGKATEDKAPDEALLTCAEWEALTQRSAEKGKHAREQAPREYEERKARRDEQEMRGWISRLRKTQEILRGGDLEMAASSPPQVATSTPRPREQLRKSRDISE